MQQPPAKNRPDNFPQHDASLTESPPALTQPIKENHPPNPPKEITMSPRENPDYGEAEDSSPVNYKKLSFGLGVFSIVLGATELLASRRITRALKVEGHEGVVKVFGVREIAAGAGLMKSPAHSARMWNRVAGDGIDLGALALAARNAPRSTALWGAIAFVIGATVLDTIVARGLDHSTGKTLPVPNI